MITYHLVKNFSNGASWTALTVAYIRNRVENVASNVSWRARLLFCILPRCTLFHGTYSTRVKTSIDLFILLQVDVQKSPYFHCSSRISFECLFVPFFFSFLFFYSFSSFLCFIFCIFRIFCFICEIIVLIFFNEIFCQWIFQHIFQHFL